jgi:hypothetical protein
LAANLARRALASGPMAERREATVALAAHILRPIGGLMPIEWRTEWDEVQP